MPKNKEKGETFFLAYARYYLAASIRKCKPRHSAWKNGCESLIVVSLYENWTLAIRFQASGVSREKARVILTPETHARRRFHQAR